MYYITITTMNASKLSSPKSEQKIKNDSNRSIHSFDECSIKIAIQKNGELTKPSLDILNNLLQTNLTLPTSRQLITVIEDKSIGIIWAKNKSICSLVENRAVDVAIVGNDQIIENQETLRELIQLSVYEDVARWPLVLATRQSGPNSAKEIETIATQFPRTIKMIWDKMGIKPKIIESVGSTEAYVYLKFAGKQIDAIADISVTGRTLEQNNLKILGAPLIHFHPVLVANKKGKVKFYNFVNEIKTS